MSRTTQNLPGLDTTVYAAGTAYQLTNSAAALTFGTTSPSLTLTKPGTYLLLARVRADYNAATFAAVRTLSFKLRRTNNTAADVTGAATSFLTQIITILSFSAGSIVVPPALYTTTRTDDAITIFGSVNTLPTAGTVDVTEAEIIAIPIG